MSQPQTICAHNAPGQALVPGVPTTCRQCGCLIEPTPRAGNVPSQNEINAVYPGLTASQGAVALNS